MEAKPQKNVSSLLEFSGHSELETGLFKFFSSPGSAAKLTKALAL